MTPNFTGPSETTDADLVELSIADISPKHPPALTNSKPTTLPSSASCTIITEPSNIK